MSVTATAGKRAATLDFRALLTFLAYGLPIVFILVPLALFLLQSFFYVHDGQIVRQLTVRNYVRIFADPIYLPIFVRSCGIALGAALITVGLGYPVALLLVSLPERWKRGMTLVFVIPLVMSYIIKIYAIRAILGSNGFLNRILISLGVIDHPLTFLIFNLQAVMLAPGGDPLALHDRCRARWSVPPSPSCWRWATSSPRRWWAG